MMYKGSDKVMELVMMEFWNYEIMKGKYNEIMVLQNDRKVKCRMVDWCTGEMMEWWSDAMIERYNDGVMKWWNDCMVEW